MMKKNFPVEGWSADSPTPAQLRELFAQIERGQITRDKLQAFLGDNHSIGEFPGSVEVNQFAERKSKSAHNKTQIPPGKINPEEYPVSVDFSQSLEDMIKAGRYDWVNPDIIPDHFPVAGGGKININLVLVYLDSMTKSDTVISALNQAGLRPATLPELLAFGARYPDMQRENPIVALASVWTNLRGYRHVPYLDREETKRYLNVNWYDAGWYSRCRFLATHK